MRSFLRQRLGVAITVAVVLLLLSANRIATFLTDLWWYQSLGYGRLYTGILTTQIGLGAVFGLALAALIAVNLVAARRLRPLIFPTTAREAVLERYRQLADPYVPWLVLGVALLFAISAGGAVAAQWDRYLLWRNGGSFGIEDPQFRRDVAFYVFDLPWLDFVQGWLFTTLILTLLVTAGAHYLMGAIRPEARRDRVTPAAKVHLSVLLALVLAARGWGYWLDRFQLNFSERGQVTGAAYTDVHAELPALNLLLGVTAVAIVLVLVNIRRRGWLLPGAAIGLLVLASVVLQGVYPAAVQRFRVDPQELPREREFIARNLEATRAAYDVADVESTRFEVTDDLSRADLAEHQVTLDNIRLWDPATLKSTYKQLQAILPYYDFVDVDVDRYVIDGKPRQVMIAARELYAPGVEEGAKTWQNLHLTYTHGFGVVSSRVNTANPEGQPVFLVSDLPPQGAESLNPKRQPAVYFGEEHGDYSLVATGQAEIDYEATEAGGAQRTQRYQGRGGVPVGSPLRRLAFAVRYADPNIVLSNLITAESQLIFRRRVQERVQAVAPFLTLDSDPYTVVLDGRVLWIQDAYTTSSFYPYSQRLPFGARRTPTNYVRNSVKAVVDAYDGTVTLYVLDRRDPIVNAWRQAFPASFTDVEKAPPGLEAHFRYPQDLFELQAFLYRTYHIPGADAFYYKADAWEIPRDAATRANNPGADAGPLRPYYLLMRLPGQEAEEFVLIQPYLALNKPNMISWLAARSDPGHYGELFAVQFPGDQGILGPTLAQARIEQDPEVSQYITLRDAAGSRVIRGNLIVIPIERSILYVEPLFLRGEQAEIPELAQVVAVMGEDVVMEDSLEGALRELVGVGPDRADRAGAEPVERRQDLSFDQLLSQALQEFAAADAALRDGDLASYQERVDRARELLRRAAEQRGVAPPTGPARPGQPAGETGRSPQPTPGATG